MHPQEYQEDFIHQYALISAEFDSLVANHPIVNQIMAMEGQGVSTEQCLKIALVAAIRADVAGGGSDDGTPGTDLERQS